MLGAYGTRHAVPRAGPVLHLHYRFILKVHQGSSISKRHDIFTMRIGVIGGGIIGTTIAATLQKHFQNSPSTVNITLIDDSDQRKYQTSQAGQGYLWSIHRKDDDLTQSLLAKQAWFDLLLFNPSGGNDDCTEHLKNRLFDPKQRGSLLIAATDEQKEALIHHYETSPLGKYGTNEMHYIPSLTTPTSSSSGNISNDSANNLPFPWDSAYASKILQPNLSALYYPHDYTCTPPELIKYLLETYKEIVVDKRTVGSLEQERSLFDLVVCCTGPWIKELYPDAEITPVRGLLLVCDKNSKENYQHHDLNVDDNITSNDNNSRTNEILPIMEIGYGSMGYHFTLSTRKSKNKSTWLLGASRENVDFDTSPKSIESVTRNLLKHSKTFIRRPTELFGIVEETRIGFRPSPNPKNTNKRGYTIERKYNDLILAYGFEGQGVLYAALAGKKVLSLILDSLPNNETSEQE